MKRRIREAGFAALAAFALVACASAEDGASGPPQAKPGFPDLRDVPRDHISNTDEAYWDAIARELQAAGAELKANPRAQYTPPDEDAGAFLEQAREDLESTRDSH